MMMMMMIKASQHVTRVTAGTFIKIQEVLSSGSVTLKCEDLSLPVFAFKYSSTQVLIIKIFSTLLPLANPV
jgi:hypothetical protein